MIIKSGLSVASRVGSAIELANTFEDEPDSTEFNLFYADDYTIIEDLIKFPSDDIDHPGEILTDSPDEYKRMINEAYRQIAPISPDAGATLKRMQGKIFKHEMAHYKAAIQLGKIPLLSVGFRFDPIYNEIRPSFSTLVYDGHTPTTKLESAVISSAPNDGLNRYDIEYIRSLGYKGRQDVAERVTRHNMKFPDRPFPIISL